MAIASPVVNAPAAPPPPARGPAAAAGLGILVKQSIDAADQLSKLSQKTGVSVETLSTFKHAAGLAGVSVEELAGALARLAKSSAAAADGTGAQAQAFQQLGISVTAA